MPLRLANLGELTCRILSRVPETQHPQLVVVLCHGFGAPGTDLVPLGEELVDLRPELAESVEFIFPAAPLSLEDIGLAGGRAWWHIDMEELVGAVELSRDRRKRSGPRDDGKREERDRRDTQPAAHPRRRERAADEREDRDDRNLDDPR